MILAVEALLGVERAEAEPGAAIMLIKYESRDRMPSRHHQTCEHCSYLYPSKASLCSR